MKQTVLITGASGGIGRECAEIFAKNGFDVVLTARSEDKLHTIKKAVEEKYGVTATVIAMDLSKPDAALTLQKQLFEQSIVVDVLINNAGFGDYAGFLDSDWNKQKNMVDLSITALMQMTYLFGNEMRKRGKGRILNLSSAAGLCPGPYMSIYYASKAFVLSFSQAVSEELKGTGVTVTSLCPGPAKTGFEEAADMKYAKLFVNIKPVSPADVAKTGYKAVMRGKAVTYHGMPTKLVNIGTRLAPRGIVRMIVKRINGIPPRCGKKNA